MTEKLICTVKNSTDSYAIEIGSGLLDHQMEYLSSLASRFAIITDEKIAAMYGEKLHSSLVSSGYQAYLFTFPSGEQYKTRATKELLENQLFEQGLGKDTCVIALGGGVVTDIAGYLAATYCRGVPLVMIPTSLLGMVDASIGGKNGVNVPYGKNMIGCIYQPKRVLIDPSVLKSLPKKELSNGIVEMIKHGVIADRAFFEWLESHSEQILALDSALLEKAILDSCRIKKEIIEEDEREEGKRHLLNFGHTVGHALENLTHYSLSHGEAVAIGMLVESRLAMLLGTLDEASCNRIRNILIKYTVPLKLPTRFSIETVMEAMILDKKSKGGKPRFVIIDQIGSSLKCGSNYCMHIEETLIKQALQWMNDALYCD